MADDSTLAALAAQITDLKSQLAGAQSALNNANNQVAVAQAALTLEQGNSATLSQELSDTQTALSTLQIQWNNAFPAPEPGIQQGPPMFITTNDGKAHNSLHSARLHNIMSTVGISMQAAQALSDQAAHVIPMIKRIAGIESLNE